MFYGHCLFTAVAVALILGGVKAQDDTGEVYGKMVHEAFGAPPSRPEVYGKMVHYTTVDNDKFNRKHSPVYVTATR